MASDRTSSSGEAERLLTAFDLFSDNFDRCFDHLHRYVSRHTSTREELERVVSAALFENVALLVYPHPRTEEIKRLESSAERLLQEHPATPSDPSAR